MDDSDEQDIFEKCQGQLPSRPFSLLVVWRAISLSSSEDILKLEIKSSDLYLYVLYAVVHIDCSGFLLLLYSVGQNFSSYQNVGIIEVYHLLCLCNIYFASRERLILCLLRCELDQYYGS